jgi:hypothetical protein
LQTAVGGQSPDAIVLVTAGDITTWGARNQQCRIGVGVDPLLKEEEARDSMLLELGEAINLASIATTRCLVFTEGDIETTQARFLHHSLTTVSFMLSSPGLLLHVRPRE